MGVVWGLRRLCQSQQRHRNRTAVGHRAQGCWVVVRVSGEMWSALQGDRLAVGAREGCWEARGTSTAGCGGCHRQISLVLMCSCNVAAHWNIQNATFHQNTAARALAVSWNRKRSHTPATNWTAILPNPCTPQAYLQDTVVELGLVLVAVDAVDQGQHDVHVHLSRLLGAGTAGGHASVSVEGNWYWNQVTLHGSGHTRAQVCMRNNTRMHMHQLRKHDRHSTRV